MSATPSLPPGDSLDVDGVLGLYACAITTVGSFYESVAHADVPSIVPIKRVAERLASATASGSPLLRAILTLAVARRDLPARAVQSAVLALLVAREVSDNRTALSRLAEAALMADSGSVLLARSTGGSLPDRLQAEVPAKTATVCLTASGATPDLAQVRTTTAFEVAWLERSALLGPLKSSAMGPLLGARLIVMVRALLSRIAPQGGEPGLSPPDALRSVAQKPGSDPVLVRLLVAAIGAVPVGTVVELDTGEWAVVAAPPADPTRMDQPRIRVVTDTKGRAREQLVELDLAVGPRGSLPSIQRIVPPGKARFNVAAALFV